MCYGVVCFGKFGFQCDDGDGEGYGFFWWCCWVVCVQNGCYVIGNVLLEVVGFWQFGVGGWVVFQCGVYSVKFKVWWGYKFIDIFVSWFLLFVIFQYSFYDQYDQCDEGQG